LLTQSCQSEVYYDSFAANNIVYRTPSVSKAVKLSKEEAWSTSFDLHEATAICIVTGNILDLTVIKLTDEVEAVSNSNFLSKCTKVKNSARMIFSHGIVKNIGPIRAIKGTGFA
jgi:hypothetical protein